MTDINLLRSLVTLVSLGLFVGLMVWTWRPAGRSAHAAAAQLPFSDEGAAADLVSPPRSQGRRP